MFSLCSIWDVEIQMAYNRYAGIKSLPGDPLNTQTKRPFRVDRAGNVIYTDSEVALEQERPIQVAELGNSGWNGYEAMRAQGQRDGQMLNQIKKAADAFRGNFRNMVEADTIGADKYFHCKANSEASSLGQYGEDAAEGLRDVREIFGQVWKGDPVSDSLEDQRANAAGRHAGRKMRGGNSRDGDHRRACEPFRSAALDRKY